jgi:signal transduction histidine kinase
MAERKREASANWSHELLTPLNGVLGGLELLELEGGNVSPGELKELLTLIRGGAERQEKLSRKLIHHYELEQVISAPSRPSSFRCDAVAGINAGATQAATEHRRTSDVTVRCEPGLVPLPDRYLTKAVEELVGNALRFSSPGQPVIVTGQRLNQIYRISISDTGCGMTADQRDHVGPFAQFERKGREQQGLGLGLAIVRNTASIAGGTFTLQDQPHGPGLIASLELPLVPTT